MIIFSPQSGCTQGCGVDGDSFLGYPKNEEIIDFNKPESKHLEVLTYKNVQFLDSHAYPQSCWRELLYIVYKRLLRVACATLSIFVP